MRIIFYSDDDAVEALLERLPFEHVMMTDDQEQVLEWLGEVSEEESCILFLDFDYQKKETEKFNKALAANESPIRIVFSGTRNIKDFKKHQKGKGAADAYLRKPLTKEMVVGTLNDFELADYLYENDLLEEGHELGELPGVEMQATPQAPTSMMTSLDELAQDADEEDEYEDEDEDEEQLDQAQQEQRTVSLQALEAAVLEEDEDAGYDATSSGHFIPVSSQESSEDLEDDESESFEPTEMNVSTEVRYVLKEHGIGEDTASFDTELNQKIQDKFNLVFGPPEVAEAKYVSNAGIPKPDMGSSIPMVDEDDGIVLDLGNSADAAEASDTAPTTEDGSPVKYPCAADLEYPDRGPSDMPAVAASEADIEDGMDIDLSAGDELEIGEEELDLSGDEGGLDIDLSADDELEIGEEELDLSGDEGGLDIDLSADDELEIGEEELDLSGDENMEIDLSDEEDFSINLDEDEAPPAEILESPQQEEAVMATDDDDQSDILEFDETAENTDGSLEFDSLESEDAVIQDEGGEEFDLGAEEEGEEELDGDFALDDSDDEEVLDLGADEDTEDGLDFSDDDEEEEFDLAADEDDEGLEFSDDEGIEEVPHIEEAGTDPTMIMNDEMKAELDASAVLTEELDEDTHEEFDFKNASDDEDEEVEFDIGDVAEEDLEEESVDASTVIHSQPPGFEAETEVTRTTTQVEQVQTAQAPISDGIQITPEAERLHPSYNETELLRLQATIRQLREERENMLSEISDLKTQKRLLEQENLGLTAELDEAKIEISILKKRSGDEIDEMKYRLRISEEKRMIAEEKAKKIKKDFERIEQKVRIDFNKVKQREKELENQLELVRMDSESQVKARDNKILELKRKIDQLEFNMENAVIREQKSRDDKTRLEDRLQRIMKTLRGSIELLEDDLELDGELKKRLENKKL